MEVVAVGEDVVGDVEVAVGANVTDVEEEGVVVEVVGVGEDVFGGVEVAIGANQWLKIRFFLHFSPLQNLPFTKK